MPVMDGRLHLGTSGFDHPGWVGPFYPAGTRPRDMLTLYATRLDSVEINYTFRREPTENTVHRWVDATPEGFRFAVKAHQRITHFRRLGAGALEPLEALIRQVMPLGSKLGAVLFQCPPNLRYDGEVLRAFLSWLPDGLRAAFEFRHPSWVAARPLLAEHGAAWCETDTDAAPFAGGALDPAAFVYVRLRRGSYSDRDLQAWADRIHEALRSGTDVFCYVKHEERAVGPLHAERLRRILEPGL